MAKRRRGGRHDDAGAVIVIVPAVAVVAGAFVMKGYAAWVNAHERKGPGRTRVEGLGCTSGSRRHFLAPFGSLDGSPETQYLLQAIKRLQRENGKAEPDMGLQPARAPSDCEAPRLKRKSSGVAVVGCQLIFVRPLGRRSRRIVGAFRTERIGVLGTCL